MELSMLRAAREHPTRWLIVKMAPRGTPTDHLRSLYAMQFNGQGMDLEVDLCLWQRALRPMAIPLHTVWAVSTGPDWATQCLVEM